MEDVKINVKMKLAALWAALMFFYTYGDILGFYNPGNIEELIVGEIGGVLVTQELLLGMAILMEIFIKNLDIECESVFTQFRHGYMHFGG